MTFSDDNGGFAFSCDDAKIAFCASTWNTRLSQIGKLNGPIYIMTGLLPDFEYISQIIDKRPTDIFIIANVDAQVEAKLIKDKFPKVRIGLHANNNAKIVLVAPETIWVSSSDFGKPKTKKIDVSVGMHSATVFNKIVDTIFSRAWKDSTEI